MKTNLRRPLRCSMFDVRCWMFALFAICHLPFASSTARAGTFACQWIFRDSASNVFAVRKVIVQPIATYGAANPVVITGDPIVRQADSAGSLIVSNLFNGRSYRVQFFGPYLNTIFTNNFDTNVTGLVNGADPTYLNTDPIRVISAVAYGDGSALTNVPITALWGSGGTNTAATNGTAGQSLLSAANGGVYWGSTAAAATNTTDLPGVVTAGGAGIGTNLATLATLTQATNIAAAALSGVQTNFQTHGSQDTNNATGWSTNGNGVLALGVNGTATPLIKLDANTGVATAIGFSGSGASLTTLNASQLASGTIGSSVLTGSNAYNGNFTGNGAGLTNVALTPWAADINGASKTLTNVGAISQTNGAGIVQNSQRAIGASGAGYQAIAANSGDTLTNNWFSLNISTATNVLRPASVTDPRSQFDSGFSFGMNMPGDTTHYNSNMPYLGMGFEQLWVTGETNVQSEWYMNWAPDSQHIQGRPDAMALAWNTTTMATLISRDWRIDRFDFLANRGTNGYGLRLSDTLDGTTLGLYNNSTISFVTGEQGHTNSTYITGHDGATLLGEGQFGMPRFGSGSGTSSNAVVMMSGLDVGAYSPMLVFGQTNKYRGIGWNAGLQKMGDVIWNGGAVTFRAFDSGVFTDTIFQSNGNTNLFGSKTRFRNNVFIENANKIIFGQDQTVEDSYQYILGNHNFGAGNMILTIGGYADDSEPKGIAFNTSTTTSGAGTKRAQISDEGMRIFGNLTTSGTITNNSGTFDSTNQVITLRHNGTTMAGMTDVGGGVSAWQVGYISLGAATSPVISVKSESRGLSVVNDANGSLTNVIVANLTASQQSIATNGFASYRSNRLAAATITVGSSPFNWTNISGADVNVYVDGVSVTGTIGINGGVVFNTIGQNTIQLHPQEYTTITYTIGTPTATWKP